MTTSPAGSRAGNRRPGSGSSGPLGMRMRQYPFAEGLHARGYLINYGNKIWTIPVVLVVNPGFARISRLPFIRKLTCNGRTHFINRKFPKKVPLSHRLSLSWSSPISKSRISSSTRPAWSGWAFFVAIPTTRASVRVRRVCHSPCTNIVGCHCHCDRFSRCSGYY